MNDAAFKLSRLALAAGLSCLACAGAQAAGFALTEQNASGLGMAFAGQAAAAEDASTIFFNPAGMTRLPGRQVVAAGSLVRPTSQFHDGGSCTPYLGAGAGTTACPFGPGGNLGHAPGGDGGRTTTTGFVPAFYASWETLPGQLWLGLGVGAPFGLKTERRDGAWVGRFHGTLSEVAAININPSVAWKITPAVSVGGGLNLQWFDAKLANAASYRAAALAAGIPALAAAVPPGAEGEAVVRGHSWAWGWNVGVAADLLPTLRLGASYRSSIRHTLEGDVRFSNRPAALAGAAGLANGDIEADIKLPDMVSIALAWQATPALLVAADWSRTGWDSVEEIRIRRSAGSLSGQTLTATPLGFDNTRRIGLGAAYRLNDAWTVRAGIAHDKAAAPDRFRTPRLPDADRLWFALGAQWRYSQRLAFDVGAAYLRNDEVPSSLANQETPTSAPRGSLVGSYEGHAVIVGAQARLSF